MKSMRKSAIVAGAMMLLAGTASAQGLLGGLFGGNNKNKENKTEKKETPVQVPLPSREFSDPTGVSGTYYIKDSLWFGQDGRIKSEYTSYYMTDEKGNRYFSNIIKFHYVKELNDNLVNRLEVYFNEKEYGKFIEKYKLDEPFLKNTGLYSFADKLGSRKDAYIQLTNGILVHVNFENDDYKGFVIDRVLAKDKNQLSEFDKETCTALLQKKLNEGKIKEAEATKAKLMENEVYKQMKGKVGFVKHHGNTGALYGNISEKMDVFISSVEIGKPVYYRAYYNDIPALKCADCKKNVIFEIEGNKISIAELRKKSSAWQSKLGNLDRADEDFFSMCPTLINKSYSNYAVLYLLYQVRSKFADGKSFKCKVTITNYRDGVDVEELATGTINLVYKNEYSEEAKALMDMIEKMENP